MMQKFGFYSLLLVGSVTQSIFAWSPLVDRQPALEHSHGLFGNPAALGSYDGPGWLMTYAPDTAQAGMLRMGLHSENAGFSMRWVQDESRHLDHTFWHGTLSLPSPSNRVSVGLRGTLWRSSEFEGNAWSASPGVLIHPLRWVSLGWAGEDWLSTHEFQKVHRFGIGFRPIDPIVLGADLGVSHFEDSWWSRSPVFAQADLLLNGFTIGARIPLRHAQQEPLSFHVSTALGERQSVAVSATRQGIQAYGMDGHWAKAQSPLASSYWVRLKLRSKIAEAKTRFLFLADDDLSLPELLLQAQHLESDPAIQGIVLDFEGYSGNAAASQEVRRIIQRFRRNGKRTVAYLTHLRPGTMLAASAADRIVLQPSAQVHFRGLSHEVNHFKGLLDRIGVRAELIRHGRFKAAVEPFTQDTMSSEARHNYETLIQSLWHSLRDSIAVSRRMSPALVDSIAHKSPLTARQADSLGLVDTLLYFDDLPGFAKTSAIVPWTSVSLPPFRTDWRSRPRIAIVTLEGEIVDGPAKSSPFSDPGIAAQTYADLVDYLRSTPTIAAIVLRIHSPGGSAQASDMLWHRFHSLGKATGIPIVASVGGMAASGGYYIACAADQIFAEPTSIVGSIGIFGGKIDASGLLQKIGITSSIVKTHDKADAERFTRPFTEEERQIIQVAMDDSYNRFVATVSEARGLTPAQVDRIGEGQVFSGLQGMQNGLVDSIGGLERSIRAAARLAGIQPGEDLNTFHIHYRSGWNMESGSLKSLASLWLGEWMESLNETRVWALWNGPDYFAD